MSEKDLKKSLLATVANKARAEAPKRQTMAIDFSKSEDETLNEQGLSASDPNSPLLAAIRLATGTAKKHAPALAMTESPSNSDSFGGLSKTKRNLLPNHVLKQIRVQDHLVAAILRARAGHFTPFGEKRKDRFSTGFEVKIKPEFMKILTPEQYEKVVERMKRFEDLLLNCGHTAGLEQQDKTTLAQYLDTQVRNGITFGQFATEIIYDLEGQRDKDGNFPFHRFRARDVGTMEPARRKEDDAKEGNSLRLSAIQMLETMTGQKPNIDLSKLKEDCFAWFQKIDGIVRQAFTHDEMIVFNLYESTDVEHNGYPVTPLDTVINSVSTHISIDTYKRLYFQNGRAAKGMLVIQSDEVDESILNGIKLQFNASISSLSNSWRTPIFGMGKEDTVSWVPFAGEGMQDRTFEFMSDQIARNIMSAFSMGPDELPGYGHLARGTNSQTLCLDLSTNVFVPEGYKSLGELLKDTDELYTEVWTGTKWEKAKVFSTGERKQVKTVFNNSLEIISSPDHRFKVIGSDGEPCWKHQGELTENDWVLINRKTVPAHEKSTIPSYKGRELTVEMMEVLGWLTGDGNIDVRFNKNTGNVKSATVSFFYHSQKEKAIWNKHENILSSFGLTVKAKEHEYSEFEKQRGMASLNAKTYLPITIRSTVYDTDFVRFLLSIGFTTSTNGKSIPKILYTMPEEFRASFLKGFFSADGTNRANSVPRIVIHDHKLRNDTKHLLMSMGIRTMLSEGKTVWLPNWDENGDRISVSAASYLDVRDKQVFHEKIGFIQDHKQPDEKDLDVPRRQERLPRSTMEKYARIILEADSGQLSRSQKSNLHTVLNPNSDRNMSADNMSYLLKIVGLKTPDWIKDFYCEQVVEIIDLGQYVDMADVEIFNDDHAFIANGILVHNSESSNEFSITASRDAGLKPLVVKFTTFLNQALFPLMDPLLSKICTITLAGLDAKTAEQESSQMQQDMPTWMTFDDVLRKVDKDPVGSMSGGAFPFNERIQLLMDKMSDVGEIKSRFYGDPAASVDPLLRFKRDPFSLQFLQLLAQASPNSLQAMFAPRPHALEFLKMNIQDEFDLEDFT